MVEQPFSALSPVLLADELIDIAFRQASKAALIAHNKGSSLTKARKRETARIRKAGFSLFTMVSRIVNEFPKLDDAPDFYYDLADILAGVERLKKSLAALNWATKMVNRFTEKYIREVKKSRKTSDAADYRRIAYGRMVSIISQISGDLEFLKDARFKLRNLPSIDTNLITIVIAGYANVGKSTFVKQVSTAKPEVKSYPFTTKGIILGHRSTNLGLCQIVDTPGLLDRPIAERNRIELQAIVALKHLADVIIFIVDPSETCGYSVTRQLRLFKELSRNFPSLSFVKVLNKIDLAEKYKMCEVKKFFNDKVFETVAKDGVGVQEVFNEALKMAARNLKVI